MGSSVLIIDGDPQFAESAQGALQAAGITAEIQVDGSVDTIRTLRPSVLLLSVELPRGSGFSICSRIRRDKALKETPIFLTSADTPVAALERHAQTPDRADDYAKKPIDLADVVQRVGKLLAKAPARPAPEGAPAEGPPPIPGGPPPMPGTAAPPPMPGARKVELERTDEGPALSAEPVGEALWPRGDFDEAMRGAPSVGTETRLKGRATPEERIEQLRQQVKQLEAHRRAMQDAWQRIDLHGQGLARQITTLQAEAEARATRLAEITDARDRTVEQLASVQQEFRAFQEEITRIFEEKDSEEKERLAYYRQLETDKQALEVRIQEAEERQVDDERRLQIMQEELDHLQTDKDAFEARAAEAEAGLAERTTEAEGLQARLTTTETVAAERADEIARLEDRVDDLAIESAEAKRQLEESHAEALRTQQEAHAAQLTELEMAQAEALAAERSAHAHTKETLEEARTQLEIEHAAAQEGLVEAHRAQIEGLTADHEAAIERLEAELSDKDRRHADLLEALSQTHEGEIDELTDARDAARAEATQLQGELTQALTDRDAWKGRAEAGQREAAEQDEAQRAALDALRAQLDAATGRERALDQERVELESELDDTADALRNARSEVAALQEAGAEASRAAEAQQAALEAELEQVRGESAQRIEALEASLDDAQTELFERSSALDALQANHAKLTEAHQESGQQLETVATALEASEAAVEEAEARAAHAEAEQAELTAQVDRLEAQHARLEATVRETQEMLEDARARVREMEDQVRRAQDAQAEAEARRAATEGELAATQQARTEVEGALEAQQRARAELDAARGEAETARAALEVERDAEAEARAELAEALDATQAALAERDEALETLRATAADARREAENLRRESAAAQAKAERAQQQATRETERLRGELAAAQAQLDARATAEGDTQAEFTALQQAHDQTRAALDEATAARATAEHALDEAQAEIAARRQRQAELQSRESELRAALRDKAEAVELWEKHGAELQAALDEAGRAPAAAPAPSNEAQVSALQADNARLGARADELEERLNEARFTQESIKGTLQTLERDLAAEQETSSGFTAQYNLVLGKLSRALALCLEALDDDDDDDALGDDLPEVEISDVVEIDHPFETSSGPRVGGSMDELPTMDSSNLETREVDTAEPFADLVRELRAAAETPIEEDGPPTFTGPRRGFDESFAGEATTTDQHSLGPAGVPVVEDDEEERDVTEIIQLRELE